MIVLTKINGKFKRLKVEDRQQQSSMKREYEYFIYNYSLNPMTILYRYMPLEAFIDMLHTGKNTLTSAILQEDKFEGGIFAKRYSMDKDCAETLRSNGEKDIIKVNDNDYYWVINLESWKNVYMQCWTRKENCEGMWKSYSHDGKTRTVKIKCKALDLIYSLRASAGENNISRCYIEEVKYMPRKKYLQTMKEINQRGLKAISSDPSERLGKEMAIKRDDYEYEREVRLLYLHYLDDGKIPLPETVKLDEGKTFKYNIINKGTGENLLPITEVLLDPWTKEYYMDTIKDMLNKYGISPKIVKRSTYLDDALVVNF